MATAVQENTGYYSALEITRLGDSLRILVNPEYAELFPSPLVNRAIAGTLLSAAHNLRGGESITFTHHPHHDFYLHIAVNNSGGVKVDGGGVEHLTLSQVGEFLESMATTYCG